MMANEKLCLRWTDFESNISGALKELREDEGFCDVTLACDEDQIQAHKVIISACSPFFRTVLQRNPHAHPLLYLKGVKLSDLKLILDFMYNGEVNVAQEELNSFLNVAEELKVKGLSGNQSSKAKQKSNSTIPPYLANAPCLTDRQPEPLTRKPKPTSVLQPKPRSLPLIKNDYAEKSGSVKSELAETSLVQQHHVVEAHPTTLEVMGDFGADSEEQKENFNQIEGEAYYARHGGDLNGVGGSGQLRAYQCKECLKWYSTKRTLREHTPSHHGKTKCQFCNKIFSTVSCRNKHVKKVHSEQYYVNLDISE